MLHAAAHWPAGPSEYVQGLTYEECATLLNVDANNKEIMQVRSFHGYMPVAWLPVIARLLWSYGCMPVAWLFVLLKLTCPWVAARAAGDFRDQPQPGGHLVF